MPAQKPSPNRSIERNQVEPYGTNHWNSDDANEDRDIFIDHADRIDANSEKVSADGSIGTHSNVTLTNPQDGQTLVWENDKFVNKIVSGGTHDYGRVFWVSATVAIDKVGTVGDFSDPFGPHALAANMNADGDVAIFMPGSYAITQQINSNAILFQFWHFMAGARINYNNTSAPTTSMIAGSNTVSNISGYGDFTAVSYSIVSSKIELFEFDRYVNESDSATLVSSSSNGAGIVRGREIYNNSSSSSLTFYTHVDIDYIKLSGDQEVVLANLSAVTRINESRIGKIYAPNGRGINMSNANASNATIKVGEINCAYRALRAVNNGSAPGLNINIGKVTCSHPSDYAIYTVGANSSVKIGKLDFSGGMSGLYFVTGVTYDIDQIIGDGGGYCVYGTDTLQKSNINVNHVQQNGDQHAVFIGLRRSDLAIPHRPTINIKHCKATSAGKRAIYIQQTTTETPSYDLTIKGFYEAPEVPIELSTKSGFSFDLLKVILKDATLYSVDGSNSIIGNINPTKVKCINVWSNAPASSSIIPVLEGINVSSEIVL